MKKHDDNEVFTNRAEDENLAQSEEPSFIDPVDNQKSKKQQLHDLDVSIVQLKNAQARRATLAFEIKKDKRKARWAAYSYLTIPLCAISLLLSISSVVLGCLFFQSSKDLSVANNSITELNNQLESSNNSLADTLSEYNKLKDDYLVSHFSSLGAASAQSFLLNHIGIVVSGSQYYHAYGCEEIQGKTFRAYNIEQAKALGYTECPDCHVESRFF